MSRCFYHPEIEAPVQCSVCGKPLCMSCAIQHEGSYLCPRCARLASPKHARAETRSEGPTWIGLLVPGLAQLLRGQVYKGTFLLVYFLVAIDAGSPLFQPLAYVLSIWDYFSPLVQEESRSIRRPDFQWFFGILLVLVGAIALLIGQVEQYLPAREADVVLSVSTVALGVFLLWYHTRKERKEVGR